MAVDIVIYHNPACGTSRTVLGLIREAGEEPQRRAVPRQSMSRRWSNGATYRRVLPGLATGCGRRERSLPGGAPRGG